MNKLLPRLPPSGVTSISHLIVLFTMPYWIDCVSHLPVVSYLAEAAQVNEEIEAFIGLFRTVLFFAVCWLFGELLAQIKLPAILGDLLAGVVLGISGLHLVLSQANADLLNPQFIQTISSLFQVEPDVVINTYAETLPSTLNSLAGLGLLFLLFATGLECDLQEMIRVGKQAATVASAGVVLPFTLGTLGLIYGFGLPTIPAVFAGAAMTATSIGITAKVIKEMGQLQSQVGQIIIGAAVLDDILGIVILAIVVALAQGEAIALTSILRLILSAIVFVGGALLLSRFFAPVFDRLMNCMKVDSSLLLAAVVFMCLAAAIALALGLEPVLGAFAAGLVLGNTARAQQLEELCQPFVMLFATVFFVSIGAATDLSLLNPANPENRAGLLVAAFLIVVAIIGKLAAGFLVTGQSVDEQLAIGTGMIPRGEVGLVFVGLGTTTGVLSKSLEVALILMVIGTTFLAPILLRLVFSRNRIEVSKDAT